MKTYLSLISLLASILFYSGVSAKPLTSISVAIPTADGHPFIKEDIGREVKDPGIYVEFLRILEKELNINIKIVRYPWKRCLSFIKSGEVDGVISASYKLEREKLGVYPKKNGEIDPSRQFESGDYNLFVKKGSNISWDGKKFLNLKGTINAQLGFSIVSFLKDRGIKVNEVSTPKKAFELLSLGHGSGAVIHSVIGEILLFEHKNIMIINPPIASKPYYLLMSHQIYKSNAMFIEKFWDKVGEVFRSPRLAEIKKRYLKMERW